MRRYFLHCTDGTKIYEDSSGRVYANDADALDHAEQIAKDLGGEVEYRDFSSVIVDEDGLEIARVPVGAKF
jgi:hypothetical protein